MERSAIIKKFLTNRLQLDTNALNFFIKNSHKIDLFFQKKNTFKPPPPVVSLEFVEKILREEKEPSKIKVLKKRSEIEGKTDIGYFVDYINKRYDILKSMFANRLDLVNLISVNRITPRIKKFSLIGIIKEKNILDKTLVLEDKTGHITLSFDESLLNPLVEDEVIGVICEKIDDKVIAKNVIFPDVPLRRAINKTKKDIYCFFISDLHMDSKSFNEKSYEKFVEWLNKQKLNEMYIFVLGDISSSKKDVNRFCSDVSRFQTIFLKGDKDIEIDVDFYDSPLFLKIENVTIFTFHGENLDNYLNLWSLPTELLTNLIKKRHLDPIFNSSKKIYKEDPYLLDIIPDIVVAGHLHQPGITNYKGITVITNGSFITQPIYWLINLRTRETFKIDFS